MNYKYITEKENYEDLASGRVLLNSPGTTAFPVRLAGEIFLRAKARLQRKTESKRYTLYDPCCGGGYLLATLGILYGEDLERIIGSDQNANVLDIARINLSMLNINGINKRKERLMQLFREYGKASHQQAIDSAERLKQRIEARHRTIETLCFQADILASPPVLPVRADLVITDIPYGSTVEWIVEDPRERLNPIERMLDNLLAVVSPHAVVAVIADKAQKVDHAGYHRLERFKTGKRQVVLLEPAG